MKATIAKLRWKLFGHVLRMDQEAPAQKAMSFYYSQGAEMRGRPQTTLPVVVAAEAKQVFSTRIAPTLNLLRALAKDRDRWRCEVVDRVVHVLYPSEVFRAAKAHRVAWKEQIHVR